MQLRLSEAQQLNDALHDPLFRAALEAFVKWSIDLGMADLISAVRKHKERDTMYEADLAGGIAMYESLIPLLEVFAKDQLEKAAA